MECLNDAIGSAKLRKTNIGRNSKAMQHRREKERADVNWDFTRLQAARLIARKLNKIKIISVRLHFELQIRHSREFFTQDTAYRFGKL